MHGVWQPGPQGGVHLTRRAPLPGRSWTLFLSCRLLLGGRGQVARQEPGMLMVYELVRLLPDKENEELSCFLLHLGCREAPH